MVCMHCIAHESLHLILFDWIHAKPQSAKITAGYELKEITKESVRLQRLDNKVWGMNSCTKIKLHAACSLFWVAVIVCALVSTHRFCGIDCIFVLNDHCWTHSTNKIICDLWICGRILQEMQFHIAHNVCRISEWGNSLKFAVLVYVAANRFIH